MRVDPRISALRGDISPQRQAQLALERARDRWRGGPAKEIFAQLGDYARGSRLHDCPGLAVLFDGSSTARELVDALLAGQIAALHQHPLGHVPLRHQYLQGLTVLQLASRGRASITLLAYEEAASPPSKVCFTGGERHETVLAGAAKIEMARLMREDAGSAEIALETRRVGPGDCLSTNGFAQTRQIAQVHGRLVLLRLARTEAVPQDSREYALADGRLLHRASGSRAESRHEMGMALLGRMGRTDAAPLLAQVAGEGSRHVRWQALRECLALDSEIGFAAAKKIAADPVDPLAGAASALVTQLIGAHPQLANCENSPCPI